MYLDYSKLVFDSDGAPETPSLILKTMGESTIGIIPGVFNLHMNIKFSEPSEISFDVPAVIDGHPNWIYDRLTGHKIVYTEHYGIYVIMNPSTESDGVYDVKHITGYSIEQELESKKFFLEEGTFKFYDLTNPSSTDTIMGRILEVARGWEIGYISPTLAQRYRTFDQYDDYLLDFIYTTVPEKFRGVFVFDPYARTINAYDTDEQLDTLPIYLDFDNLVETVEVNELSDELVTALRPYGADELDIRDVNPIGTNWIYDLSYFISNGDIPEDLAEKWNAWQASVLNYQEQYRGLVEMRSSATAQLLAEKAALVDLQGELDTLVSQQSVTIQALAMETTASGKQTQQALLDQINADIAAKKAEISAKENTIAGIESNLDASTANSYAAQIQAIVNELSITSYFTDEEYAELSRYLIEQDITESTFVATTVDTSISGISYSVTNETMSIQDSAVVRIDLTDRFSKRMYTITGGKFSMSGSHAISGDIIRGTLEENNSGTYVLSLYGGSITSGSSAASSGMVTVSGTMSGLSSDIQAVTVDGVTAYEGTSLQFSSQSGTLFLTANVSDYQKYSVQMELYDYAVGVLSDLATPTYEFSVDSGNFIFATEFAPFRDKLELGKGVYLNLGNNTVINPYIIEFELDFEDRNDFSVVFSNRFKRHDNCNTLKDMIEKSYSSSRSFDASKYIYNQTVNHASAVSEFMNSSLDAAKNTIIAASNQSVVINGSGIHVGGDSNYQLRIVDSMIAMTDDNWEHAKLAIGLFSSEDVGTYFGVNAEVIGGKLIVGNNLVIENETDTGIMQFKVDSSGAWLNNSTFVLQKDNGGKLLIDPDYGIVAGTSSLFTTSGTTVSPSFVDSSGSVVVDSDGIPQNANFFLDLRDGNAYFRGKVTATSGKIGGFTIEETYLHGGSGSSYIALHGSGTGTNSAYAIWAGSSTPSSAPFSVTKSGNLYAKNGTFSGTVSGAAYKDSAGNSMMNSAYEFTADYLNLNGINVGNGNFVVDSSGNVSVNGSITMAAGSSINWAAVTESNVTSSSAYARANTAYNTANNAYDYADDAYTRADNAYGYAVDAIDAVDSWTYGSTTYIDGSRIMTGTVSASTLEGGEIYLLDGSGRRAGSFTLEGSSSYSGRALSISSGAVAIMADYGSLYIKGGSGGYIDISSRISCGGNITPNSDGNFNCGTSSYRWGAVYSNTGTIQTSDKNKKNSIEYLPEKYINMLDQLSTKRFKLNNGESGRFHVGFIAQDVESAMEAAGISSEEFGGWCKDVDDFGRDTYMLRYDEFLGILWAKVKQLENRIADIQQV